MRPLDDYMKKQLKDHLLEIEEILDEDVLTIIGPIIPGLEILVKKAIESCKEKRSRLCIILDTEGGVIEVTERMVDTIRHHYESVTFVIPNRAMSAGTIFALSGNRIIMYYFSCLGPIDPQVIKDDKLVPALSYLNQFDRLNKKASEGNLTQAEYALLSKMDLAELDQFEQIKILTIELVKKWLFKYKFKDWIKTETRDKTVTPRLKKYRARQIAEILSDSNRWHSHGRGINMETLIDVVRLKIENISKIKPELDVKVTEYYELLKDYLNRENVTNFVHSKTFF
jgi:hypothetical protein